MHIPENYLSPSTCAVMTAAMLPVWGYSINKVRTEIPKAKMTLLGIVVVFWVLCMFVWCVCLFLVVLFFGFWLCGYRFVCFF